ncbi:SusC/RagA family TonB-linked outer membrane protein [Mucilaginibacter arboris]|uniref:SusC/RagA family TonB-linked outer membrane protein n=1 Tax=Mucilaginibacter arboris TaxID=2682090 RepID=A0A7K1SXG7_9SPHI|nr:TonB-dependent receptor [Mucilaginibacter arboris]MVN22019.1 SusC/RagA family TonB-linked outer membrane protein [Mucilaginibacter arboris]
MKKFLISLFRLNLFCTLLFFVSGAFAQQTTITGTVSASDGPLPGASVTIKGTQGGTATDINGKYTLKAAKGNVLVFQSIGFTTQQITVGATAVINVKLQSANSQLNEVVVIGYGTQKRSNVTGALSSLKADNLDERAITRVDQALVGQLAGVTVKQTTGVPGKAFSVTVRGSGSISAGNDPLYVIDGFPLTAVSQGTNGSFSTGNPLDNINPNDIENIEVLKDAAAAAIYGSRASNGVVLITTKRGKTGKPNISYNTYFGYNEASKTLKMLNGQQWIDRATEMINAAYVLKYGANGATANDNAATRTAMNGGAFSTAYQLDPRWSMPGLPGLEVVDWQKAIERKGLMQNHQLSASGGSDAVRYFISGNYADQNGFVKGLGYKAYSARANVEVNASKNLKLGVNIAPTYSITEDPGVEGKDNIFHQALSMTPIQEDSVGLYANIGKNAQYIWSNTTNSPVGKLQYNVGETKRLRTLSTIYGEYEIVKGLNFRSSLNLDNTDNNTRGYTPYITTGSVSSRTFNAATNPNVTSATSGSYSSYKRLTFVNENTLTYNHTFNNVHSLNVLLGQSYNFDRLDQASLSSVGGYTSSVIQTLSAAAATTGSTSSQQSVLLSYFSRVQYGYKDKYLLSASLRTDGSSRFGQNNKYGVFPSASLGWRVVEESFMKSVPVISDLKLRASFGVNGNNNIGNYGSIATLGSYGYVLGSTQAIAIGQAPNVLANPDLKWEKSQTYDGGIDFGLFKNRLTGSFDYYNKLNTQLLLNVPVLETTGFQSYLSNAGSVRNTGEELELTSRNLINKFQWSTTLNVSHNANKIVALYGNQTQIIIPNSFDVSDNILRVGQPINSIYVVKQIGILTQADINNKVAMYNNESVGDPKYQDLNGDGVITEADKQIVGHPNPNYTWGVTNTFRYKGFDLSVLVQGQNGGSIYSLLGRAITRTGQGFTDNAPYFYADRWESPSNPGAGRVSKAYSTFGFIANTDWLYSSDYVRVRDITLGYNLKNLIKTRAVQGARIYITAENFFGHDKYYGGLNPEAANTAISSNSAYPEAGDYGGLPLAKSLIFGLNFTF